MKFSPILLSIVFSVLMWAESNAQLDPSYVQYWATQQFYNPAYMGSKYDMVSRFVRDRSILIYLVVVVKDGAGHWVVVVLGLSFAEADDHRTGDNRLLPRLALLERKFSDCVVAFLEADVHLRQDGVHREDGQQGILALNSWLITPLRLRVPR